jgi:histidinol-phosphate aminotransferase
MIEKKVRGIVKSFKPYEWEASSESIARKYNLQPNAVLRFDMNTSPFKTPIPEEVLDIEINEYPDPAYEELATLLASYARVKKDEIIIGAGADEVLDVIAKTFIDNGDKVLISVPTYSMFGIVVATMGGKAIDVQRGRNFSLDSKELVLKSKEQDAKLVFICNPNSPTGNFTKIKDIEKIVKDTDSIVVVDEAYLEFCGESSVKLLGTYKNLIIVRTLSKAFSIAGARVGYAISCKELIKEMSKVRPPNSLSGFSIALAKKVLRDRELMKENVVRIVRERGRIAAELKKLKLKVFPSCTNFLLVNLSDFRAGYVFEKLMESGMVTRNVSGKPGLENCLRITIRNKEQNDLLVERLGGVLYD